MFRRPASPPAGAIPALLQAGLTAQRQGQAALAEQTYRQVLALDPRNADALQLLGLLAKQAGQMAAARDFMEKSLKINRRQPNVLSNLGNLHLAEGRAAEALACYDAALALAPGNQDYLYHRAKSLHALGKLAEAEKAVQVSLSRGSQHLPSLQLLALILFGQDRLAAAEAANRQVLALAPDNIIALNNLALTLRGQHRYPEAEPICRRAVALAPAQKEPWLNLANVLSDLGQYEESIGALREVLRRDAFDRDAHRNLARRLWTLGRTAELFQAVDQMLRQWPDHPTALDIAAGIQAEFGRGEEALANSARAVTLAPNDAALQRRRADLLLRAGQLAEATPILRALTARLPQDKPLWNDLAVALTRQGEVAAAREAARSSLALDPYDQHAIALLATLDRLADPTARAERAAIDRCVGVFDLPTPAGWPDRGRFLADTLAVLDRLHDTVNEPIHLTLRRGTQTSANLFAFRHDPPLVALREMILTQVQAYVAAMPADPAHPYFGRRRGGVRFAGSWSSRLRDGGFHTHHIHPEGWISGVFYLQVPPAADKAGQEGWLTFGVPNLGPEISLPALHAVQPRPGRLVLFPSFMWHGTVPFQDETPRITIAFDLVPD